MEIRLRLFASLRERAGESERVERGLPERLDVSGLKSELESRHPEWGSLRHVRGVLGTEYVADDTELHDGDEVALLPPVSGGACTDTDEELERGVFELLPTPLDLAAVQARVAHVDCGGVATFTGMTRATTRDRTVEKLDYEAFEAMAGPEMLRIFARCRELHGNPRGDRPDHTLRMFCQHRTGTVRVGEPSVMIAVASPHRDRALSACRFLIDELKASLPIWKRESYPDGEFWVGDRS